MSATQAQFLFRPNRHFRCFPWRAALLWAAAISTVVQQWGWQKGVWGLLAAVVVGFVPAVLVHWQYWRENRGLSLRTRRFFGLTAFNITRQPVVPGLAPVVYEFHDRQVREVHIVRGRTFPFGTSRYGYAQVVFDDGTIFYFTTLMFPPGTGPFGAPTSLTVEWLPLLPPLLPSQEEAEHIDHLIRQQYMRKLRRSRDARLYAIVRNQRRFLPLAVQAAVAVLLERGYSMAEIDELADSENLNKTQYS